MLIRLIGPGGAGKSTVGAVLAHLLALPFLDLDRSSVEEHGDIDRFIGSHGYHAYARANVEVYRALARKEQDGVLALSSGFMTYPPAIHPQYADLRCYIERSTTTFVLLPSLDLATCVAEIVRRQLGRPFSRRGAEREEAVIRDRVGTYLSVAAPKIETMRPAAEVAAEILARLPTNPVVPQAVHTRP
jgi:shikimate kinase